MRPDATRARWILRASARNKSTLTAVPTVQDSSGVCGQHNFPPGQECGDLVFSAEKEMK